MTNLNRLFSRYFIITIAIVLVMLTLVSNIGGSAFFRRFIRSNNEEKNESIVEIVTEMLDNDSISSSSYPLFLVAISRQEKVDLILWYEDELISYVQSGENWKRFPPFSQFPGKQDGDARDYLDSLSENDDIEFTDYEIGLFRLSIGRPIDPLFNIANANFLKRMNIMYIIGFLAAMAVAFLAALILSRRFNKPIMQLRDNVNNISMNRFEDIKPCDTKASELKELSEDINGLAAQLQKEDSMRKRLSNDIVHELKTPIAVLSTNIEAILDGVYKADDERMSVLLSQTNRLARLINNLSDLTMLETENKNDRHNQVNLTNVLESIFTVYMPAASDKNIDLQKEIENDLLVNGNEDRLLQVFVNILSNSMKYTDEGGNITIRAFSSGGDIVCEVEDNGIGIDDKDLPFIFNRFYRGDESRSRATGGSGIGLAIAKAVVSSHGGEIKVNSKKGEGTKITVVFQKTENKNP
jgi:signal transduction histidine kinase